MADITTIASPLEGMPAAYEALLGAIGSEDFGPAVRDAVNRLTGGARRIYLYEARGRSESHLHYYDCEPSIELQFADYGQLYLQLDPLGEAFRAAPRLHDMVIQRVQPSDIASAGFRRRFFDDLAIVERVSLVQRGADGWRGMNLARHASQGVFTDSEIEALIALARVVLPMLPFNRVRRAPAPALSAGQFEARFASRYPSLTRREREVCARAAMGMSVEATALDLGIGRTSVLTYRQRAYRRLGIGSPMALGALIAQ